MMKNTLIVYGIILFAVMIFGCLVVCASTVHVFGNDDNAYTNYVASGFNKYVIGINATSPNYYGYASNINLFLLLDNYGIHNVTCALYYESNETLLSNGITEWRILGFNTTQQWYAFNFTIMPVIYPNTRYYVCAFTNGTMSLGYYYINSGFDGFIYQGILTYPNFPNPLTPSILDPDAGLCIYCNYVEASEIHLIGNMFNASASYYYVFNDTGYYVYANVSGNTTSITWSDNHIGTSWSHSHYLLLNNSWLIYDNDTGVCINITYLNISGNVDVTHMGNVTGMINVTMGIDINQVSIVVLLVLMAFFAILGYAIQNAKTQAAFLMFAGIFSILAMISVDIYFGGIWYLSTPGFIIVSVIFFKDILLMIIYGDNWRKGNKK